MDLSDVLVAPLLTEKSSAAMAQKKVTFKVKPEVTKRQVKLAVEWKLGAKVEKINMIQVRGKHRRMGRYVGQTAAWKKAMVTLKPGQKIELLEGLWS